MGGVEALGGVGAGYARDLRLSFAFSRHDTKEFGIPMSDVYFFTPRLGISGGSSLESKRVMSCALGVGKVYIYIKHRETSPLHRAYVPLIYKLYSRLKC